MCGGKIATHSSILARTVPWTEEPERTIVLEVTKTQTWLSMPPNIHKIHHLVIFLSGALNAFLCNYHHSSSSELLHFSKLKLYPLSNNSPFPLLSSSWEPPFHHLWTWLLFLSHISGIIHYLSFCDRLHFAWASLIAQLVKNLPAMQETPVQFLGQEDPRRRDRLPTPVFLGFLYSWTGKESACNVGDLGPFPKLGRSPGEGNGYPLQYSGLENSMDCMTHGIAKSRTWLSILHFIFHLA